MKMELEDKQLFGLNFSSNREDWESSHHKNFYETYVQVGLLGKPRFF